MTFTVTHATFVLIVLSLTVLALVVIISSVKHKPGCRRCGYHFHPSDGWDARAATHKLRDKCK